MNKTGLKWPSSLSRCKQPPETRWRWPLWMKATRASRQPRMPLVFGARRPGFPLLRVSSSFVHAWIAFMQAQGITRVLCLLPSRQLDGYADLLGTYRHKFGEHNVLWVPINDFQLAEEVQLIDQILPF